MALAKRHGPGGDGLNKRYDTPQLRTHDGPSLRLSWGGIRRRRILLGLVALGFVWLFIKNIPTDVPSVGQRYNQHFGSMASGHSKTQPGLLLKGKEKEQEVHGVSGDTYDGPIRFINLAVSLRAAMARPHHNVLFALARPASASTLVPFACQMSQYNRSTVHIALLGRHSTTIEDVIKINNIGSMDCSVVWHDAMPDYAMQSSPARIYASIRTAIAYIQSSLRPQVVMTDDLSTVDPLLMGSLEDATTAAGVPLITLPANAQQALGWITSLDTSSLIHFNIIQIEIVVQAYTESAGNLITLLRSLKSAHYTGLPTPRLTIELPSRVEPFLISYLEHFKWPPGSSAEESRLTIRRRIDLKKISPAEASLRTVELFYPALPATSHVLMLNPDVELSPDYLHYLMFTLLEYKYGQKSTYTSQHLFGISLELPRQKLDGSQPFIESPITESDQFVLSQTPNSHASLYFGDKWVAFHSFLSKRLALDPQLGKDDQSKTSISTSYPQWINQARELMQAQGSYLLYPAFSQREKVNMAVLHAELHRSPEEFAEPDSATTVPLDKYDISKLASSAVLSPDEHLTKQGTEAQVTDSVMSMLSLLSIDPTKPGQAGLLELSDIPLLSFEGTPWDWDESEQAADRFADEFSTSSGGCTLSGTRDRSKKGSVEYLFCEPG